MISKQTDLREGRQKDDGTKEASKTRHKFLPVAMLRTPE
jgi:hypothetical protein